MFPRPAFASLGMQQASWHSVAYDKEYNFGGALQVTGFYEQSYKNEHTSEYFLFGGKNKLTVATGLTATNAVEVNGLYTPTGTRDILGQWLGFKATPHTTYSGEFTVTPEQNKLVSFLNIAKI